MAFGGTTTGKVSIETSIDTQPIKAASEAFQDLNTEVKAGNAIYDVNTRRVLTNAKALDTLSTSALNVNDRFLQTAGSVNKLEAEFSKYATSQEIVDEFSDKLVVRSTALKDVFGGLSDNLEPLADSYDRLAKATTPVQKAFELIQISGPKVSKFLAITVKQLDSLQETLAEFGDSAKPITDLIELFEEKLKEGKLLLDITVQIENLKDMFAGLAQTAGTTAIVLREVGGAIVGTTAGIAGMATVADGFLDTTTKIQIGAGLIQSAGDKIGGSLGSAVSGLAGFAGVGAEAFDQITMWGGVATAIDMATREAQGFSEGMEFMANQGFDTSMMALAMSLGVVGENLLFNIEATKQLEAVSIQAYGQLEQAVQFLRTISAGREIDDAAQAMQDFVDGPLNNVISSTEATYLMYNTLSAGIGETTEEAEKFTETVVKLAKGANADIGTVQEAMIFAGQAFGMAGDEADKLGAKIVTAIENGVINLDQMSAGLGRVSGTMAALGADADNTFAAIAAISQNLGADTNVALNSLANAILGMGTEAQETLAKYGASLDQNTIKTKGFIQALVDAYDAIGRNDQILKTIIPDSLGFSAALSLVKQNSDVAEESLGKLAKVTGDEVTNLFDEAEGTIFKRLERIQNGFQEFVTGIGKQLLKSPLIDMGVRALERLLEYFQEMPPFVQTAIGAIVGFNKILGITSKVLFSVAAAAAAALGAIVSLQLAIKGFGPLLGVIDGLRASFGTFVALLRTGEIGKTIPVMTALKFSFRDFGGSLKDSISDLFSWKSSMDKITGGGNGFVGFLKTAKDGMMGLGKGVVFTLGGINKLGGALLTTIAPFALIAGAVGAVVAVFTDLFNVGVGAGKVFGDIADSLGNVGSAANVAEQELARLEGRFKSGTEEAKKYQSSVNKFIIGPIAALANVTAGVIEGTQKLLRLTNEEGRPLFETVEKASGFWETAQDSIENFFGRKALAAIREARLEVVEYTNKIDDLNKILSDEITLQKQIEFSIAIQTERYKELLEIKAAIASSDKLSAAEKTKLNAENEKELQSIVDNVNALRQSLAQDITYEDLVDPDKFKDTVKQINAATKSGTDSLKKQLAVAKSELKEAEKLSTDDALLRQKRLRDSINDLQQKIEINTKLGQQQEANISFMRETVIRRDRRLGKSAQILASDLNELRSFFTVDRGDTAKQWQEREAAANQAHADRITNIEEQFELKRVKLQEKYAAKRQKINEGVAIGAAYGAVEKQLEEEEARFEKQLANLETLEKAEREKEITRAAGVTQALQKEKEVQAERIVNAEGLGSAAENLIRSYEELQSQPSGFSLAARATAQEWGKAGEALIDAEVQLNKIISAEKKAGKEVDFKAVNKEEYAKKLSEFVTSSYELAAKTGDTQAAAQVIADALNKDLGTVMGLESIKAKDAVSPEQFKQILADLGESFEKVLEEKMNLSKITEEFQSALVTAGDIGAEESVRATRKAQRVVIDEQIRQIQIWMDMMKDAGETGTLEYQKTAKELKVLQIQARAFDVATEKQLAQARLQVLEDELKREKILNERQLNEGRLSREQYERDLVEISNRFAKEQADERVRIAKEELATKTVGSEAYLKAEADLIEAQQERIKLDYQSMIAEMEQVLLERTREISRKLSEISLAQTVLKGQETIINNVNEALKLELDLLSTVQTAQQNVNNIMLDRTASEEQRIAIQAQQAEQRVEYEVQRSEVLAKQAENQENLLKIQFQLNDLELQSQEITVQKSIAEAQVTLEKLKQEKASKDEIAAQENAILNLRQQLGTLGEQRDALESQLVVQQKIAKEAADTARQTARMTKALEEYDKTAAQISKITQEANKQNQVASDLIGLLTQQVDLMNQLNPYKNVRRGNKALKLQSKLLKAQAAIESSQLKLKQLQENALNRIVLKEKERELSLANQAVLQAKASGDNEALQNALELKNIAAESVALQQQQMKLTERRQAQEMGILKAQQGLAQIQQEMNDPSLKYNPYKRRALENKLAKQTKRTEMLAERSLQDVNKTAKEMALMEKSLRETGKAVEKDTQGKEKMVFSVDTKGEMAQAENIAERNHQDLATINATISAEHAKDRELISAAETPPENVGIQAEIDAIKQKAESQQTVEPKKNLLSDTDIAALNAQYAKAADNYIAADNQRAKEDMKVRADDAKAKEKQIQQTEAFIEKASKLPTTPAKVRVDVTEKKAVEKPPSPNEVMKITRPQMTTPATRALFDQWKQPKEAAVQASNSVNVTSPINITMPAGTKADEKGGTEMASAFVATLRDITKDALYRLNTGTA